MVYVMGDIHGNLRRFESVMNQIQLAPADTLYVLGDVIDRHPHGLLILRRFMKMGNVKMILGNHEYMMLNAIGTPGDPNTASFRNLSLWYRNGGKVTHNALKHLRIDTRKEIFSYLESLPLNIDLTVNDTRYKLVHGGPVEEYPLWHPDYPDETYFAVWKRWSKYEEPPEDYTMIFGHTPTNNYQLGYELRIWYGNRMIGLDCGSGFPEGPDAWDHHQGRLACLRLDDMQEFYSTEDLPPAA